MSVYVDELQPMAPFVEQATARVRRWGRFCHLWADTPEELHEFAESIGLKRSWCQEHPSLLHYDLSPSMRRKALAAGAVEGRPFERRGG